MWHFFCTFADKIDKIMELRVIAHAENGFTDKFGIPRQSRESSGIETRIVFEPTYAVREALRGIEDFSHLWLLWGFSEVEKSREDAESWSPTVRPPRLGGNKRVGVFATRSPYRPNPIGLTSVKLLRVEDKKGDLELVVSGADLLNGTPIYDIKPYLRYSDSHPEAKSGFADEVQEHRLEVDWGEFAKVQDTDRIPIGYGNFEKVKSDLNEILSQDPRPAYQDDPDREYKLDYGGYNVTFFVKNLTLFIKNITFSNKK